MTTHAGAFRPTVDFWWEPASTYSYLAAMRIEPLAESHGVTVRYCPFTLGPIFAAKGWSTSPFNLDPIRGRYMWRDMERLTAELALPFRRPSVFPRNSIPALRIALIGVERGFAPAFLRAVSHANFAEDRDIAAAEVLNEILATLGLDGPALQQECQTPAWKPRLRSQTERAASLGVFGAPSFMVGEELFWGNDRLEQSLAWAMEKARAS